MKPVRCGLTLMLTGLLLSCGCASLARYDVRVKVDNDLRNANGRWPPVEVHLVVLGAAESDAMAGRKMSDYWSPGHHDDYEVQKIKLRFGEDQKLTQEFLNDDPRWDIWKHIEAPKLWVLADLPGSRLSGAEDTRRLCVPLERTHWRLFWSDSVEIILSREKGVYRHTVPVDSTYQAYPDTPSTPSAPTLPSTPSAPSAPYHP